MLLIMMSVSYMLQAMFTEGKLSYLYCLVCMMILLDIPPSHLQAPVIQAEGEIVAPELRESPLSVTELPVSAGERLDTRGEDGDLASNGGEGGQ